MTILFANTNTGTLNNSNNQILNRIHDTLTNILNDHGQIDIFTIQETNKNEPSIPPFFTDAPVNNHSLRLNQARGIATYALENYTKLIIGYPYEADPSRHQIRDPISSL